jgi:hypothetical protein
VTVVPGCYPRVRDHRKVQGGTQDGEAAHLRRRRRIMAPGVTGGCLSKKKYIHIIHICR